MIRRLATLVAAAVLAVGATVAPASADGEIGLSYDGSTWSNQLTTPLFDTAYRWSPGDVEERTFLVRNDGPSPGELTVDVLADDPAGLLSSADFKLEARLGSGAWVSVVGGTVKLQPTLIDVPRGAVTSVTVRGTFRPEATGAEDVLAPFLVRVTLSEDGDVAGVDAGKGDKGGKGGGNGEVGGEAAGLPDTGPVVGTGLLWLAAGLVGTGLALVRRGRREREVRSHG